MTHTAQAATASSTKLEQVATTLGQRIWDGYTVARGDNPTYGRQTPIHTEASAHLAVIANISNAGSGSNELRRAISTWLLAEHGAELATMTWEERTSALDWALKSV